MSKQVLEEATGTHAKRHSAFLRKFETNPDPEQQYISGTHTGDIMTPSEDQENPMITNDS